MELRIEAIGDADSLRVVVYDGSRAVGLAPMARRGGSLVCRSEPILDPEVEEAAGAALVGFVREIPGVREWVLDDLPADAQALSLPTRPGDRDLVELVSDWPRRRLRRTVVFGDRPDGLGIVREVLADVDHQRAATRPADGVARWERFFDRTVRRSAEGSAAPYSLGDPGILRAATDEVAARLDDWGLLGPEQRVLDLGCGIGRFEEALADRVGAVVGVDVSGEMVDHARRRCAGRERVRFVVGSGLDLATEADGRYDLVLAVDAVPYLVLSGPEVVDRHFAEARRVLRPGGSLVVLQFSYRGDPAADREEVRRLAEVHGFLVLRPGVRAFTGWDGLAFHLLLPGA